MKARRRWLLLAVLALVVALALVASRRHVRAASMLARFEGDAEAGDVASAELSLGEGLRARRYAAGRGPAVLLVHGAHRAGIDEPRLTRFARLLASEGLVVVTPEIDALRTLRADARAADAIADAAHRVARREGARAVGVVGVSLGGGLALRSAALSPRRESIGAVLAIGAHHDARRIARGWIDRGGERYGPQVLAYAYAGTYFGDLPDAEAAREALGLAIAGDRPALRVALRALSPPARARIEPLLHGRSIDPARARLRALLRAHGRELAALSPAGHLSRVRAEVFLLHGEADALIPPGESDRILRELPAPSRGGLVRTPMLRHADRSPLAGLGDRAAVVHLVARALRAFERLE